jgi:hypothetical protein
MIFRRYAELGSVALLKSELERAGIVSKRREGATGQISGGRQRMFHPRWRRSPLSVNRSLD